jgi:cytochrome bd-type quinol oxidase subunit 2
MPTHFYQVSVGVVLLIVLTIAYGGTFVLSVTRGNVRANDLQRRFFRAGHAHAGVLVILGLLALTLEQLNHVRAPYPAISFAILAAAVLMPAGFFLSVIGRDPDQPNRAIALLWAGAAALAIGLISAGVGLIAGTPS